MTLCLLTITSRQKCPTWLILQLPPPGAGVFSDKKGSPRRSYMPITGVPCTRAVPLATHEAGRHPAAVLATRITG